MTNPRSGAAIYNDVNVAGLVAQGGEGDTLTFTNSCPRVSAAGQANLGLDDISLTRMV